MTEEYPTPTGLVVEQMATMASATRNVILFDTYEDAVTAHDALVEAVKKYHDRTNDRERLFTLHGIFGPVTFNVDCISGVGVDQANHPAHLAWARAVGEINRISKP